MQKFSHLLCYCSAVNKCGQLAAYGDGLPLYPWQRAAGYAAAYNGDFAERLVLFGPKCEHLVYTAVLNSHGVPENAIECHETHETTIGNGQIMREYVKKLNGQTKAYSTSGFHASRASVTALLIHGLEIPCIPAESFIFAAHSKMNVEEARTLLYSYCPDDFSPRGNRDLIYSDRDVSELKGIGDLLAERYSTQKRV